MIMRENTKFWLSRMGAVKSKIEHHGFDVSTLAFNSSFITVITAYIDIATKTKHTCA